MIKTTKVCHNCKKDYHGIYSQKYCSKVCHRLFYKNLYSQGYEATTGTKGAIGELAVSLDLMKSGYDVFRALSPSCPFDLVAFKNKKFIMFEVRTGRYNLSGKHYYCKTTKIKGVVFAVVTKNEVVYYPPLC